MIRTQPEPSIQEKLADEAGAYAPEEARQELSPWSDFDTCRRELMRVRSHLAYIEGFSRASVEHASINTHKEQTERLASIRERAHSALDGAP